MQNQKLISTVQLETHIHLIRGHRVLIDSDLAQIYGVTTKRLNEQVKRNIERFPSDFMFQLNNQEFTVLRSQIATLNEIGGRGQHRKYLPNAFTEHGAIMAANVLNSKLAVDASIQVVRAFIHLRQLAISHADLAKKLNKMEQKYDSQFKVVFDALRQLMHPIRSNRKPIGFIEE